MFATPEIQECQRKFNFDRPGNDSIRSGFRQKRGSCLGCNHQGPDMCCLGLVTSTARSSRNERCSQGCPHAPVKRSQALQRVKKRASKCEIPHSIDQKGSQRIEIWFGRRIHRLLLVIVLYSQVSTPMQTEQTFGSGSSHPVSHYEKNPKNTEKGRASCSPP